MKKRLSILVLIIMISLLTNTINAVDLTTLEISTNKTLIKPNEEIELNIDFGESLISYNFNIAYDKNLVEFVSTDGGEITDIGTKVIVNYNDETSPKRSMRLIFKGKNDIITSNPTNFAITADSLKKENETSYYDAISVSIIKNFVVEPEYDEYSIDLKYSGEILEGKEKEMNLIISSSMGKPYEHARIIIESIKPSGTNIQLLGIDEAGLKHDMIQSGWGDASGYPIGGKDVEKVLKLQGIFSDVGNYTITAKIIDRDNSDFIISQKSFSIEVKENINLTPTNNAIENTLVEVGSINNVKNENTITNTIKKETLLKTGSDGYMGIFVFTIIVVLGYLYLEKKKRNY